MVSSDLYNWNSWKLVPKDDDADARARMRHVGLNAVSPHSNVCAALSSALRNCVIESGSKSTLKADEMQPTLVEAAGLISNLDDAQPAKVGASVSNDCQLDWWQCRNVCVCLQVQPLVLKVSQKRCKCQPDLGDIISIVRYPGQEHKTILNFYQTKWIWLQQSCLCRYNVLRAGRWRQIK